MLGAVFWKKAQPGASEPTAKQLWLQGTRYPMGWGKVPASHPSSQHWLREDRCEDLAAEGSLKTKLKLAVDLLSRFENTRVLLMPSADRPLFHQSCFFQNPFGFNFYKISLFHETLSNDVHLYSLRSFLHRDHRSCTWVSSRIGKEFSAVAIS